MWCTHASNQGADDPIDGIQQTIDRSALTGSRHCTKPVTKTVRTTQCPTTHPRIRRRFLAYIRNVQRQHHMPRHAHSENEVAATSNRTHFSKGTMSPIVMFTIWNMPPPPIPCIARAMMSQVIVCAAPHNAEPICQPGRGEQKHGR